MWAAVRPALPWVVGALVVVAAAAVVTWLLVRQRLAAAKAAEKHAEHLWHHIDCVTEPTMAIDMRPLVASAEKAKFSALTVITDVRERIAASMSAAANPDWTADDLAAVKAMTDRSAWPLAVNYRGRGVLPRVRVRPPATPKPSELAARIARIRNEQKVIS